MRLVFNLLGFALLVASGIASDAQPQPASAADSVVATINGEPVSAREFALVMSRQRARVYAWFKEHEGREDSPTFWSADTGDGTPAAMLQRLTLEELTKIKVQQRLAKERGLISDTSYSSFLAEFERENARRAQAVAAGQVIYGPPHYDEATYYFIRFNELVHALRQRDAQADVTRSPGDKELAQNFNALIARQSAAANVIVCDEPKLRALVVARADVARR